MIIKHSQQDIIIDMPLHIKDIALKISGGADSAILSYILAMYKKDFRPDLNIHTITSISSLKPYQDIFSNKVLAKVESLIGKTFNNRFVHTVDSNNYIEDQFNFAQQLVKDKKTQLIFVGCTKNPTDKLDTICDAPTGRDGINMPISEGTSRMPFANINKKGIYEIYLTLGVLEEIFPLTRSCEEFPTLDFSKHCEKCWFCAERLWGFGRYV